MRRGRPRVRRAYREAIVTTLCALQYPVTANTVKRCLRRRGADTASWHTVRKYLQELCEDGIVSRQVLPTERGRKPLVVYFMRGR